MMYEGPFNSRNLLLSDESLNDNNMPLLSSRHVPHVGGGKGCSDENGRKQ